MERKSLSKSVGYSSGRSVGYSTTTFTGETECETLSIAPDGLTEYRLDAIGKKLGLARRPDEDSDAFAGRCHYRIDDLIREHALQVGAHRILQFMDLHDAIERLVP